MLNKQDIYAVVGASNNPDKYGYKVVKDLIDAGYNVVPINKHEKQILGLKVYKTISEYENKIDMVVFVVPPVVTEEILFEVLKLNIKNVWLQPGSESNKAVLFCQKKGIKCIHDACVMINK